MIRLPSAGPRCVLAAVAVGAVLVAASTVAADNVRVLLRYAEIHPEIRAEERGPTVTVYEDGGVLVHYPDYMKQAGTYAVQLDDEELEALTGVVQDAVRGFDANAVEQRKRDVERQRRERDGTVFEVHDASRVVVESHLPHAVRSAAWTGLRSDQRRFPGIPEIQGLATADRAFRGLMQRSDLSPVE